ncbi:hypothetical protein FACS189431_4880 [Alphaproteobacteria bacterium]|nr:hypothetical protein FACS189431_4880 [Alphaproteobacteria bacterium]
MLTLAVMLLIGSGTTYASSKVWVHGDGYTRIGWLEKGEIYHGQIEIYNEGTESREVLLETTPYTIDQNDGDTKIFSNWTSRTELADWVTFPDGPRYTFGAEETRKIDYTVTVPTNAITGSQSAAISVYGEKGNGESSATGTSVEGKFMWILFADINGDPIMEKGAVTSWDIDWLIFDNAMTTAKTTIENRGNLAFTTKARIKFESFFDGAVMYEDEKENTVLAEGKRVVTQNWGGAPVLGLFNVSEEVSYLDRTENFSKIVLIVPIWFVIIFVTVIILLLLALVLRIKERNK